MKKQIDSSKIHEIEVEFEKLQKPEGSNIMKDGILCLEKYKSAKIRIMWVVKQNINYDKYDYSEQIKEQIADIDTVGIWKRIAQASHGFLSGERDLDKIKTLDATDRQQSFLSTAIIEANKELSDDVRSPDQSILDGYKKYEYLVKMQIEAYAPDVVIVGMTGRNEALKPITESIHNHFTGESEYLIGGNSTPKSADVAWSRSKGKTFLWAYHPSYTGLTDKDYFDGLMNAFDAAQDV